MSLLRTAKAEVLSPGFFVNSALFSLVYALLFVFISNHKLFTYSIDHYGIYTTYKLLLNGVLGLPNSLSRLDLVFFVITSILVGLNFALIIKTLDRLKGQKISKNDAVKGWERIKSIMDGTIISGERIKLLESIVDNHKPTDLDSDTFIDCILNLQIIVNQNGSVWYEVNPIIEKTVKIYANK